MKHVFYEIKFWIYYVRDQVSYLWKHWKFKPEVDLHEVEKMLERKLEESRGRGMKTIFIPGNKCDPEFKYVCKAAYLTLQAENTKLKSYNEGLKCDIELMHVAFTGKDALHQHELAKLREAVEKLPRMKGLLRECLATVKQDSAAVSVTLIKDCEQVLAAAEQAKGGDNE